MSVGSMTLRNCPLGLSALLLLAAARLHAQEYRGPIWGGTGGTATYNLDCGSAGILVGVYGKVGLWVDQLGIICQTVKADGTLGGSYTKGPVGGPGGTSETARCPSGQGVGSAGARAGSYIEYVHIACWPWDPGTRRLNTSGYETNKDLGEWSTAMRSFRCSEEKIGKALRGKYGSYIDSMQFVCDDYNK
jgi:hypothetical protein